MEHFTLLLSCTDRPGIVHYLTGKLLDLGANIVDANQHITDETPKLFYIRLEFTLSKKDTQHIANICTQIQHHLQADLQWFDMNTPLSCSILVSKEDHCLEDLLYHWKSSSLFINIHSIISNHDLYQETAQRYGIPFYYLKNETKETTENHIFDIVEKTDALILARYMQVLSPSFLSRYTQPIINIHHSFLPSFSGAKPYHQAYDRGVKLIGATAHIVTEELDAGPIIAQNVAPITHRHSVNDLKLTGQTLEKHTLLEAIQLLSKHRVMVHGNKTIIF